MSTLWGAYQSGRWLFSARFHFCITRVRLPPVARKLSFTSPVRLLKIRGSKTPETTDAVGGTPTASKVGICFGGERGIRTLETLSTPTRFPIVRLRPAQPSLHCETFSLCVRLLDKQRNLLYQIFYFSQGKPSKIPKDFKLDRYRIHAASDAAWEEGKRRSRRSAASLYSRLIWDLHLPVENRGEGLVDQEAEERI